jgi:hypothetical protein
MTTTVRKKIATGRPGNRIVSSGLPVSRGASLAGVWEASGGGRFVDHAPPQLGQFVRRAAPLGSWNRIWQ